MHIKHDWEFRGADSMYIQTGVLYRCKICGKLKVKYIGGVWTKEDLDGK